MTQKMLRTFALWEQVENYIEIAKHLDKGIVIRSTLHNFQGI